MSTHEDEAKIKTWVEQYTAREWISVGLQEVKQAEAAFREGKRKAAVLSCKRGAGMALNALKRLDPTLDWATTYVQNVEKLAARDDLPELVAEACRELLHASVPGEEFVLLRTPRTDERLLESARNIAAFAYAAWVRAESQAPYR